jgi:hypothetical protein
MVQVDNPAEDHRRFMFGIYILIIGTVLIACSAGFIFSAKSSVK